MPKIIVNCAACGIQFEKFPKDFKRSELHYCSRKCLYTPSVPMTCQECGYEFLVRGNVCGEIKLCSSACHNARDRREQPHKKIPQVTLACERCGKAFSVRRSIAKVQRYCSQKCSGSSIGEQHRGDKSPVWKGKADVICDHCGKHFQIFPSRQNRRKYCCKEHFILGTLKRFASGKRTDLEVAMANALKKHRFAFDEQVIMFDKFLVDFKLRDFPIIIQCDGLYWHNRPNVINRDKGQDRYLAKAGYVVLRFSDQEILKNMNACVKRIKQTIATGQIPLINW